MEKIKFKYRLSYTQLIVCGFLAIILAGALLLSLPIASRERAWTSFPDAFFAATSACCVTGLTLADTYTYWSLFGQIVLLVLIQIGGLGFMTVLGFISAVMKKRLSLHQRKLVMQAAGHVQLGGVITLVKKIFIGTFLFEGVGTVLFAVRFCPVMGVWEGLYNALFHSISVFCSAGFDLMGRFEPGSSLMLFRSDLLVQGTVMALTALSGVGFFVWTDILQWGIHVRRYTLHTKIALMMSVILILSGWAAFYFLEYNGAMAGFTPMEKVWTSLFQSVSTRTVGMTVYNQAEMTGGVPIAIVLMLIGGSPGSTAGGIKTTTVLIAMLSCYATIRGKKSATIFKKRIGDDTVKQASAIVTIYLVLFVIATVAIMTLEACELSVAAFETAAALGTAGLSLGLTPSICTASKYILALLMFVGRIGGYSFMIAFAAEKANPAMERPVEKVLIG